MDKVTVTLKPCPFCGGEAGAIDFSLQLPDYRIGCRNPECAVKPSGKTFDPQHYPEAITAWNTRQAEEQFKLLRGLVEEAFLEGYALGGRPRDANRSWEQSDSRQALEATNG